MDLSRPCTQEQFAAAVGVAQQAIADLVRRGTLRPGEPAGVWLLAYCARLRDAAAGRIEAPEVAAEKAALLRAKRQMAELELQARQGRTGDIEHYKAHLFELCRYIRDTILTWPARAAASVRAAPTDTEAAAVLESEAQRLCSELANAPERMRRKVAGRE